MAANNTVHIVDDDINVLDSTKLLIRLLGHDVSAWNSPADFLNQASIGPEDLILLDLRMPDYDGFSVFRQLRASGRPNQAILMTGHGDSDLEIEAYSLGICAILHKPFSEDDLVVAIQSARATANSGQ
jgi:FixJ family two-component response regulator